MKLRLLAALALAVLAASCGSSDDDATEAPPAPTTTTAAFTVDGALAVSDAYFATHNAGDIESVFALFTADATFQDNWSGLLERTAWEPRYAWDMAQGETLASPECTVVQEAPGSVTIRCAHRTFDAAMLAVGSPPIPTNTTLTVTPDGISEIRESYGNPDFGNTGEPFTRWMEANHPEDAEAAGCCEANTVEESIARGELRAQYAQEWAAYLDANGCTYNDTNCASFTIDEALAVSDAYFAAYETSDVDTVRGLFALDAKVVGSSDLEEFFGEWELISAWDRAQGAVQTVGECAADQPDGAPVTVKCEWTDHQYIARAVGAPPVPWTTTIRFDEDGKISTLREDFGQPDYFTVNTPFNSWMRANHPEDASKVDCCGGDTVEESIAFGTLRSAYADEWVAYLDANACGYTDGC